MSRIICGLLAACVISLLAGCAEMETDYGATKGVKGRTSLNGFGALRTAYELNGYRSRDVSRLTDRVRQSDVIVWTPRVLGTVDDKVTRWFDRWLKSGNKTLIYIVPDSGSEADYWLEAGEFAPPAQRIEYRKRAARSINERMMWRLNRNSVLSNGWFEIEPLDYQSVSPVITGPWKENIQSDDKDASRLASEYLIKPFDADAAKATPGVVNTGFVTGGPTGPASQGFTSNQATTPTSTNTNFKGVITNADGGAFVAEVRSDDWKNSQIIVVAGGSMLTNFAFSHPTGERLAAKIIAESKSVSAGGPDPLAGFLTSDWDSIPVSETKPGVPVASGMELLTVWPLSLVTMHGVMLGVIVCLMLWPILGRPKKVQLTEHNDFGDHLDAVASLMNRAGGEEYAREKISEYFKRIRGETSGPWVINDRQSNRTQAKPLPPMTMERKPAGAVAQTKADPEIEHPQVNAPQVNIDKEIL